MSYPLPSQVVVVEGSGWKEKKNRRKKLRQLRQGQNKSKEPENIRTRLLTTGK
jgi:hypothetical protein